MLGLAADRARFGCVRTATSRSTFAARRARVACIPRRSVLTRAGDEPRSQGGDSMESLFLKELKKRGISAEADAGAEEPVRKAIDPFTATSTQAPPPASPSPSSWVDSREFDDQLSRSRQLNSEGIEGLVPRASKLVQLGGSVFLAFLPFIAAISLLFGGIYWLFGERFVHSAPKSSGPPAYIDPDALLNSPTVDPYVTFDQP